MAVFSAQNAERIRYETAAAIFAQPFKIGERVLDRHAPWNPSSVVTACERTETLHGPRWRVTHRVANCETSESASRLISAPAGWVDPPAAPLYSGRLALEDFGIWADVKLRDAAYQAQLRDWRREYATWCQRHLAPLGYHEYTARAMAAAEMERQSEAAE